MSKINTNVSSLIAQNHLFRSNNDLQTALNRLSTGLRINNGKDDPAGLIASEDLRRDITAINKAISNSERANQLIATADGALGQVSNLLNDIRGLVTEAANSGALSTEQIAANQLQVDSSLEAIDRISQVTTFQGRRLLDGSLDFIVNGGLNFSNITELNIEQATIAAGGNTVDLEVTAAATVAQVATTVDSTSLTTQAQLIVNLASVYPGASGQLQIDADAGGAFDGAAGNVAVTITENAAVTSGSATASFNSSTNTIEVLVGTGGVTTTNTLRLAISAITGFTATENVAGVYDSTTAAGGLLGNLSGGQDAGTGLVDDVVFQLSGLSGSEVFSFSAGTNAQQIRDAVNLLTDATGIVATGAGDTLNFDTVDFGENAFVDVETISGTFISDRQTGTNAAATVDGFVAKTEGNKVSVNTAVLDLSATIANGFTGTIQFAIEGGGAIFQLGPEVVTNQQARLGIDSVNTGKLGGATGRLFELRSGGARDLASDATGAAQIVDEVITNVSQLRGRLGAFQSTTLESNIASLKETVANLTEAESSIRDADFAVESAALTRAQILVQSGTAVLAIANQNPQNVLALLR